MHLWLSSHLLLATVLMSSSALTPEECQPLVTPLSLADPSVMYSKVIFLLGYSDNNIFKAILNVTESSWVESKASPSNTSEFVMSQENRINGTCVGSTVTVAIKENTAIVALPNMTSVFHLLPSCPGCQVFSIKSNVKNGRQIFQLMNFDSAAVPDEIHARSLYLLASTPTLKDSDLEHFKKQASCLGFSGEPDFQYNTEKSLCKEGEGIRMPYSQ